MTSAAILAGGRARRFDGRDKTQLRVGGRTMLERQIEALSACADRVFLVGYSGSAPVPAGVIPVEDRAVARGPLGGLDAALAAAQDQPVLLLACDMPNVTTMLLSHLTRVLGTAQAAVPRTERGYHPLCAVYAQSCRDNVERRLRNGELRMIDLVRELDVRPLDRAELSEFGDADHLLANVNTQADLDALESLQSH
jgi:molybdopterin-guanine dinucleotide biosynthesis protein A